MTMRGAAGQQAVERLADHDSVCVSTLEVASSRIRKRGLCASARAKLTSCRWPTENVAPRSLTSVSRPCGRESRRGRGPLRAARARPCRAVDHSRCPGGRWIRACRVKQERILQHDAELAAQVRARSSSRMSTPSSRISSALDIVEAQQQLDRGWFCPRRYGRRWRRSAPARRGRRRRAAPSLLLWDCRRRV